MKTIASIATLVAVVFAAAALGAQPAPQGGDPRSLASLARLPIHFIENGGVHPAQVAYFIPGASKTLFFTCDGITILFRGAERGWAVRLDFVGANRDVVIRGAEMCQARFSYFLGPQSAWRTGLRTYGRIVYEDLWPGVDLIYRAEGHELKYEFVLQPGVDPDVIRLRYTGASSVKLTGNGALRVATPVGELEDTAPIAWQDAGDRRAAVKVSFSLAGDGTWGFRLGDYDPARTLVIDPSVLVYCGYLGGSGADGAARVAVDATGSAYITGETTSAQTGFPAKVGPDLSYNSNQDAFVAKINAAGTALVYCGYIGGFGPERGRGIAVDPAGCAYVIGSSESRETSFPVKTGPDLTHNGGLYDVFVAKVDAKGTSLVYCGYIGGRGEDYGEGIAVDAAGNVFVTGQTRSDAKSFPVSFGPDLTYNGGFGDIFVARLNAKGTTLDYCGYIGGSGSEVANDLAIDATGNAYLTGLVDSNEKSFPVKVGPDLTYNGSGDGFVAKVSPQGVLAYCGYVGGANFDAGNGIAVDASGRAFLVGNTYSDEKTFPVKVGPDLTHNSANDSDAFVARVNATGKAIDFCGYIGGKGRDWGQGVAVDAAGFAHVAGGGTSDEKTFPVVDAPDLTQNGGWDVFAARVSPGGAALVNCGYIGGNLDEAGRGVSADALGNAFVVGYTGSDEKSFPVRVGPDATYNGGGDAFLAKLSFSYLVLGGTARPGSRVTLTVVATGESGAPYQLGTSLGTGPIPIDTRRLELSPDELLRVSVTGVLPWIFSGYQGVVGSKGQAAAAINLPNIGALIGLRLHSAFVTLSPSAPSGIRSISKSVKFTIAK